MKTTLLFLLLTLSTSLIGQEFVESPSLDDYIQGQSAFGDDEHNIVVVEFWIEWNKANAFGHSNKLEGIDGYYLVNAGKNVSLKDEYEVMIAPTLLVFVDGIEERRYKAGLDMKCPVDLSTLQEDIKEILTSLNF